MIPSIVLLNKSAAHNMIATAEKRLEGAKVVCSPSYITEGKIGIQSSLLLCLSCFCQTSNLSVKDRTSFTT